MNDFDDIIITPESYQIDKDKILNVVNNRAYNKKIIEFYKEYFKNPNRILHLSPHKVENISNCNKLFLTDRYDFEMIKELRKTNLCHDKFCNNCKKVKQASRMSRYIPFIEPYSDSCYHLVLTVPSVTSDRLKDTLDIMNKSFMYLMRYFKGSIRINGIDFKKYGYLGAIRSTEITFKDNLYHPHFHVLLCLKSRGVEESCYVNKFSYSTSNGFRKFTDLEILIQKIWFLLVCGVRVTKSDIDNLECGFSCTLDKFVNDDYIELFKYLTKDFDDSNNILSYDNFVSILEATYGMKQIQGYGIFYRIIDENLDEELLKDYDQVIEFLKTLDKPVSSYEKPSDLLNDPYTLISRKQIIKYINR